MTKRPPARRYTTRSILLVIFAAVVVFFVSAFHAAGSEVSAVEEWLFHLAYSLPESMFMAWALITHLGSVGGIAGATAALIVSGKHRVAGIVVVTGLAAYHVTVLAKNTIGRERPEFLFEQVFHREGGMLGPGFPSGHTAIATVLAATVWLYMPKKYRPVAILWVVLVGFSRLYLGVHLPLDIVGGFCIGLVVSCAAYLVVNAVSTQKSSKGNIAKSR